MSQKQKENYVKKIWTDPSHPAAYAGPSKLYKIIRQEGKYDISRGNLKKILAREDTYSVQKPAKKTLGETEWLWPVLMLNGMEI